MTDDTPTQWQYAQELSERHGERVKFGYSPGMDVTNERDRKLADALAQVGLDALPDGERLDHVELYVHAWERPEVKVWCKATDFNYRNSRVTEGTIMHAGHTYPVYIDIRPF